MAVSIEWDRTIDGHVAFLGPKELGFKLAVLGTRHHQGLMRNGQMIMEPMPRETWALHFTRPIVSVNELQALLDSLPAEA